MICYLHRKLKFFKTECVKKRTGARIFCHNGEELAFTLVEFIIYFAITIAILSFLILSFMNLMDSREKVRSHIEVSSTARHILESVNREIINAYEIISPAEGDSANSLFLRTSELDESDPPKYERTSFRLLGGDFYKKVENGDVVESDLKLNHSLIDVNSVVFERISENQIKISIRMKYAGYESYGRQSEEIFRTIATVRAGDGVNVSDPLPEPPEGVFAISNCAELQAISEDLSADYILINDIDCFETPEWNNGDGFEPIGTVSVRFTGSLNGGNYVVSNLYINRPSETHVGMFGYLDEGSEISNFSILNASVVGGGRVGILAGEGEGLINNVHVSGLSESENNWAGGMIYGVRSSSGSILNSSSNVTVKGGNFVGGLAGLNLGTISNSHSVVEIQSTGNIVGGLVGRTSTESNISFCSSIGSVVSTGSDVGGLVGEGMSGSVISSSHSHASVHSLSNLRAAGFIGISRGSIYDSYATGFVAGSGASVRCFTGFNVSGSTHENNFCDIESSGRTTASGSTGKTTAEMKQQATFTGWDFVTVWNIGSEVNSGYPYLRWQYD